MLGFGVLVPLLGLALAEETCNWHNGCGPCLSDATPLEQRRNLDLFGTDGAAYNVPFRISQAYAGWDSHAMFSQIFGILIEEKLGINVEFETCWSQASCTLAASACANWGSTKCKNFYSMEDVQIALAAGQKKRNDTLADIMFFPETEPTRYLTRTFFEGAGMVGESPVVQLGPSGFTTMGGIYTYADVHQAIWDKHGIDVGWFGSFAAPEAREFMHSPKMIDDAGASSPENNNCESWTNVVNRSMELYKSLGWTCHKDGWWINAACAALGDRWYTDCMVIIDMSWEYSNEYIPNAAGRSPAPVAQRMVSWSGWVAIIQERKYNISYQWWKPDATHPPLKMVRSAFPEKLEANSYIVLKAAWVNALQANARLRSFLSAARLSMKNVMALMEQAGESEKVGGQRLYYKMSCDWIKANEAVWSTWLPSSKSCLLGQFFDEAAQSCSPCPVGTEGSSHRNGTLYCRSCSPGRAASQTGQLSCEACAPGSYGNGTGQSQCQPCPIGEKNPREGQTQCTKCAAGTVAGTEGSSACMPCGPGFHAPQGSEWCIACDAGRFSNSSGAADCTACGNGLVTEGRGANKAADCICPRDFFRVLNAPEGSPPCEPCPGYFSCQAGSDMRAFQQGDASKLRLVEGYMTTPGDPSQVYMCMPAKACPGGAPGRCAALRDPSAVACGRGLPDTYSTGDTYEKCADGGEDSAIFAMIAICGTLGLMMFGFLVSKDPANQTMDGVRLMIVGGICITGFQTLGVLDSLSFAWFEPLRSVFQVVAMAALDFKHFRLGCAALGTPTAVYAVRQLVAPLAVPALLIILLAKRYYGFPVDLGPELVNAVGNTFAIFFPAVVISCVVPFICFEHPGSDLQSMVSEPSVLCFEADEHLGMVWLAVMGLLVVALPYLALSSYGTYKHHSMMASHLYSDHRMLRAFRFLYTRYTPECHYYGLLLSLRSLAICLVPIFPGLRHDSPMQICCLSLILSLFLVLQQWLKPWKAPIANMADGLLMTLCLQLLVVAAVSAATLRPVFGNGSAVHVFGTVIFIVFCLLAIVATIMCIHRLMVVTPFYSHFICHHKAGAAAQARLMKIIIQEKHAGARVFIDSDDLQELDILFDTVKRHVGTLVIYLTRDTLRRPWCAGEVCTALKHGVNAVAINTESYIAPTETELLDMKSYLDCPDVNLSAYGIEFEHIADAFRRLNSEEVPVIRFPEGKNTLRWADTVDMLSGVQKRPTGEGSPGGSTSPMSQWRMQISPTAQTTSSLVSKNASHSSHGTGRGLLLVSSEPGNDEACAASLIVLHKINAHIVRATVPTTVRSLCDIDDTNECLELVPHATAAVVLLSSGTLSSMHQISVIVELMAQSTADVIPVKTPNFQFPNDVYYTRDLPTIWRGEASVAEYHLRAFFRRIAISLDIAGSDAILSREAEDIYNRTLHSGMGSLKSGKKVSGEISSGRTYSPSSPMSAGSAGIKSAWAPEAAPPPSPPAVEADGLDRI